MVIEKITKDKPLEILFQLKSTVTSNANKSEKVITNIDSAINVLNNLVDYHGLMIQCHSSELLSLVDEYIHLLSNKHHLAMVIQVSTGVSVYDMKRIDRIAKTYSSQCSIIPRLRDENLISFYICYFTALAGEKYDIDYFYKYT